MDKKNIWPLLYDLKKDIEKGVSFIVENDPCPIEFSIENKLYFEQHLKTYNCELKFRKLFSK